MRIALISPNYDRYSETFIKAHKKYLNGKIYYYYGGFTPTNLEGFGIVKNIYKSLIDNDIDLVYAEYGQTGAALIETVQKLNIPIIVNFHGYDAYRKDVIKKYKKKYTHIFNYKYSSIIAVSSAMKQQLIQLGCPEDIITVTPCGPNEIFFNIIPNYQSNQFLSIGRFTDKKAPYLTIDAFHKVCQTNQNCTLTMIGEGPLLNYCKSLVSILKIEDKVHFVGSLDHNQIREYLKNSFCYVQHSITAENGDSEGTPVSILEASLSGIPVISTRHAGIKETIVEGKSGFLVDEKDTQSMALHMVNLLEDKSLASKLGTFGKKHIKSNYSIKNHIKIINDLIADIDSIYNAIKILQVYDNRYCEIFDDLIQSIKRKELIDAIHPGYISDYIELNSQVLQDFRTPHIEDDEILLSCTLRDANYYIENFISHHKKLGINNFVFILNNTSDNSYSEIKKHTDLNIKIIKCDLNFKLFSLAFRKYSVNKFGPNKWNLVLDIDELFDYPFSNLVNVNQLINYLEDQKFTAVITQMLDLFPSYDILKPPQDERINTDDHIYYNLKHVTKKDYWLKHKNKVSNKNIKIHSGGIRNSMFNLPSLMLTKHSLFKNNDKIEFNHIHFVINAEIADFSCCLLHYKFNNEFRRQVKTAVKEKQYFSNSRDYNKYYELIERNEPLYLRSEDSNIFEDTNSLIQQNFLRITSKYLKYVGDIVILNNDQLGSFYKAFKVAFEFAENNHPKIEKIKEAPVKINKIKREHEIKINSVYSSKSYVIGNKIVKFTIKYFSWLPYIKNRI